METQSQPIAAHMLEEAQGWISERQWDFKDQSTEPPREGEPLSNRGGGGGRSSGQDWDGQRSSRSGGCTDSMNKPDRSNGTSFNCQKMGQYRSECPEARTKLSRIHSTDPNLPESKTMGRVNEVDCPIIQPPGRLYPGCW